MTLDCENIVREQKELRLLNQQLHTQVGALQNNSTQTEGDTKATQLHALDELIQKWIVEIKLS